MNLDDVIHDKNYIVDGTDLRNMFMIAKRLYEEGVPLRLNERRDLAQRLSLLLQRTVEL